MPRIYAKNSKTTKNPDMITATDVGTKRALDVNIADGDVTLNAGDIELGAVEIKDASSTNRLVVNSDGTVNVLQHGDYQDDATSLTDQSFSFTASEIANTTKILEFIAPTDKTKDFMVSVYNPSTETALLIQAKNMLASFGGITRPGDVDSTTVNAQSARVNPTVYSYYDQSATSFASDLTDFTNATANDCLVPGHAAAEVEDAIYIGYTNRFRKVHFNVGTAKTDVSTLVWEYWNGSAWATLTDLVDGTVGFTQSGVNTVAFNPPIGWAKNDPMSGGTNYYYIRCRCSAYTSAGTQGLITQGNISDNYNADVASYPIYGLFNGASKVRMVISNNTAIGAAATVAGAGAFTGWIRITPI